MLEDRPLDLGDAGIADVGRLLRVTFPEASHLDADYLDWCYRANPAGAAIGRNAYEGESLAAHYVTVPLRARVFGREETGVLSLHTATHPEHQGKGLFTRLAEATYRDAAAAGHGFVVGVANAASTPGFVRKLGFQLVRPLDVRVGFGPAPLGDAGSARFSFERLWDEEALRWRLACPARSYRRASSGARTIVYAPTGRLGVWAELASFARDVAAPAALAPLGLANPLRLWMGLDASRAWRGAPWTTLPGSFRPSPLNLIFRDLRGEGRTLDPAMVRFAALDFDAY